MDQIVLTFEHLSKETFKCSDFCKGIHPIYSTIIKHCIFQREFATAKKLLNLIELMVGKPNDVFFNKLIDFASK